MPLPRGIRRLPSNPAPLQPQSSAGEESPIVRSAIRENGPDLARENQELRRIMTGERRRHAKSETMLADHNDSLKANIADLRALIIARTAQDLVGAGR
jgi:hypothetical protein